ncbi:MAG: N-6 DNA methylase [Chloroflexi bacterium]|nr:N-6 DNA methylase [Chloroflexota bacterium]
MAESVLETYFRDLLDIRGSGAGVKETSYYPALSTLFNEIGKALKPKVRCILQLANKGAGNPDGGFFTPDQLKNADEGAPLLGANPSRGVIEVKGTGDDVGTTADSPQVLKYLKKYRLVLVTNYRDFVLVGQDREGNPVKLESYRLANSESDFWSKARHPQTLAREHEGLFTEYLRRVMLHAAPLAKPKELAWFLASYARTAKTRIEGKDLPALADVRKALEEALGLQFQGDKGDHFFRSTLVQTLFYGVFSAWVLWSKKRPYTSKERFDWRNAAWDLRVPMIRALFERVATATQLGPLNLVEVLDWTGATLNRVDRASFFAEFDEGKAVQYFYEPFLEAFDPELRKQLGVWYTPPEIVQYMVARVDTALREELGLPDGLADPSVYVLDPCCGTGSYLVAVLERIAETLKKKGGDALVAADLKDAAMKRVFGFEILPAPFVVSHLQLGLLLQGKGAPLDRNDNERAGVYLTNALTGWEPPTGPQLKLTFPELEQEREAAQHVKRDTPILVILGNPPYNAFDGTSTSEEEIASSKEGAKAEDRESLVEAYKRGLTKNWGIKKFNLDDLYVRFFRLAERRIAEQLGRGIICYISNFSYLGDPSFVVMRKRLLQEFDGLWFDCMNGDSRETGKLTPDGKPDPSVFSTEYNREGIRVGTTIGLMVREPKKVDAAAVHFRHFWGVTKRAELLESLLSKSFNAQYQIASPDRSNRYSFRPASLSKEYPAWPKVADLCAVEPYNGPIERRGNSLIRLPDEKGQFAVLEKYLDPAVSDEAIRALEPRFMRSSGEFKAEKARASLKGKIKYDAANVVRYPFKPFDVRVAYLDPNIAPLFSRPSPQLLSHRDIEGNALFITRDTADKDDEGPPLYFSRLVCDYDTISGHARHVPLLVRSAPIGKKAHQAQTHFLGQAGEAGQPKANLALTARQYLASLAIADPDADAKTASLLWVHALAIGYSFAYLEENRDGIRLDWPRIPLPDSKELLLQSAALGERVAALLDTEKVVSGVTVGAIRPELAAIASIAREGGGQLQESDLGVTAGWGHAGKGGVVMPGRGKLIERDYTNEEKKAISRGAEALGLSLDAALSLLGERTCDVYLNDKAYWRNVPVKVWEYHIGGYQVVKKWLSYRDQSLLGRPLTKDEAREVMNMARRIAAILLLQPGLDTNYQRCKDNVYPWPVKS